MKTVLGSQHTKITKNKGYSIAREEAMSFIKVQSRVGCFIFSPFLKSKMPRVPKGGVWGNKFGSQIFFDYDVILRLHASIEISSYRIFVNVV